MKIAYYPDTDSLYIDLSEKISVDIPVTVFPNSEYALENKRLNTEESVKELEML